MHRESCHRPEANKNFQSSEHLYGTYLPYQLAYGSEALWSGRALVRLSCIQHTLGTAFCRGVGADDADDADPASELQNENAQLTEAELAEAELAASELSSPEDHLDGESISRAQ